MPLFAIARRGEPKKPFVLIDATSRARAISRVAELERSGVLRERGYFGAARYHVRVASEEHMLLWLFGEDGDVGPGRSYAHFLLPLHWPNRSLLPFA